MDLTILALLYWSCNSLFVWILLKCTPFVFNMVRILRNSVKSNFWFYPEIV
jgi:hypothetical protein